MILLIFNQRLRFARKFIISLLTFIFIILLMHSGLLLNQVRRPRRMPGFLKLILCGSSVCARVCLCVGECVCECECECVCVRTQGY